MAIAVFSKSNATRASVGQSSTPMVLLLFLWSVITIFSPTVYSQDASGVEIGSGTLDSNRVSGQRWQKVEFEPVTTGSNTISVAWDSDAVIRFSLFRVLDAPKPNDRVRIATSRSNGSPTTWTGTLDASEQYFLGIWSVSGSGNFTASIQSGATGPDPEPTPDPDPDPTPGPIEITERPASLSVTAGQDATFTVAVSGGNGTLDYQWFVNDEAIVGENDDTLTIRNVATRDSGRYRIEVTDDSEMVAFASATLTVTAAPVPLVISAQPVDVTVDEGRAASFSVTATGDGALSYQWYKNNRAITGATRDTLLLRATEFADNGTYRVDVTDDNNTLRSNGATLEVIEDSTPVTIVNIGAGTVDADKNTGPRWVRVDFDALATAVHTISVSWDSTADVRYIVREATGAIVSPTVRGSNPGVWSGMLEAGKEYYLGIRSTNGDANFTATVSADVQLSIVRPPRDVTVVSGSNATFTVEAIGSGTLSYQWFLGSTPLRGETGSSLTVFSTDPDEDGSRYRIEISNGIETIVSNAVTLNVDAEVAQGGVEARWKMDELSGASVMRDVSGHGRHGTVGRDVITGDSSQGTTSYRWPFSSPTGAYQPGRIINVPHYAALNPGSGDYSITMRYRTNVPFGNIIQKGQGGSPGGYWKIENPAGNLTCVFRGRKNNGEWSRKEVVSSRPLNDGRFHTITCERIGTTLRLIVDGVLHDTAGNSVGSIANNQPMSIGGKTNCDNVRTSCDYFSGWIDEISISKP